MWDPRAKLILGLCLFTIYLTVTECKWRRRQVTAFRGGRFAAGYAMTPARKTFEDKHVFETKQDSKVTQEFLNKGRSFLGNIKIPNKEFCTEMILMPEDLYLVLPWWYNYCQDQQQRNPKDGYLQGYLTFESVRKYLLGEVELYKKRLKEPKIMYSELEEELIVLREK